MVKRFRQSCSLENLPKKGEKWGRQSGRIKERQRSRKNYKNQGKRKEENHE